MSIVRRNRHATVAVTAAAAAASWALVTQVAGVHLGVQFPGSSPTTVALGPAIGAAATSTLLGWATLALLEKRASRPRRTWVAVAVAALVVSLSLPVAFATTASAALGLAALHVAVAAVAITGLARTATARRGQANSTFEPTAPASSGGLGVPGPRDLSKVALSDPR
jgi:heme A synthase